MLLRGEFALSDLALLTFVPGEGRDGDPDNYEDVLGTAGRETDADPEYAATDTDIDIGRGPWGWSALVLRADVEGWKVAGAKHGYDVEVRDATAGHFGDGHWKGVDLVEVVGSTTRVYWIDREASA